MAFDTSQSAYKDFRNILTERSDPIVAWVGAGLSQPAGLPSWSALRESLTKELHAKAAQEQDQQSKKEMSAAARLAEVESNLWDAFSLLKDKLGNQTYEATIRRELSPGEVAEVPSVYKILWQLRVSGILSLNIDRLAARAFNEVNGGKALHTFTGFRAGDHAQVLRSQTPWLANLHGTLDETNSWVFTSRDLAKLLKQPGYRELVRSCFMSRTVVFVGISADDIAAGSHLEQMTESGINCTNHFWITNFTGEKRKWAERVGIRVIHYNAPDGNHRELEELVTDLRTFRPVDDEPLPVALVHPPAPGERLREPDELLQLSASEIRKELNAHASGLLADTNHDSVSKFEAFSRKYSEAIYRAWYVDIDPPKNRVLQYELLEKQAEGAFGTVYRAAGPGGANYAVKILHERIRTNPEMLQSFRRGVRSMRILADAHTPGVVGYYDASEIPAMVVMEFIEGLNLAQAVEKRVFGEWQHLLRIACDLSGIIRHSHKLPQRVLHRDIRPQNVMLKHCWGPNPDWTDVSVWVLDFDLSYHLDAFDVSISQPGNANGYLAPEQADRTLGVSTRNSAVDSFGLGMTLYFLRTGTEPQFAEHRYENWKRTLEASARRHACKTWISLPMRFFRLVYRATKDRQEQRVDMASIKAELDRLLEAVNFPYQVKSAELLAEELAARCFGEYDWDQDKLAAVRKVGVCNLRLVGNESELRVYCEFDWLQSENEQYTAVRKWLPRAKEGIEAVFRKAGWKAFVRIDTGQLHGNAFIHIDELRKDLSKHAEALDEIKERLSLT